MDFRSILDGGLSWALRTGPAWTLDGVTALAWNHEEPIGGPTRNDPGAVLQLVNKVALGTGADTTQRVTFYPNFTDANAHRSEAEVNLQAAMSSWLALKVGYLWRHSAAPVPGFKKSDTTTTASLVMRWKSTELVAAR
jgi:hypothetical protein